MNEQDKRAYAIAVEKWEDKDEWNKTPSSYDDFGDGWQAALEYERNDSSIKIAQAQALAIQERERSKKLVEALEYHVAYSAPSFTKSQLEDALREYRGEM